MDELEKISFEQLEAVADDAAVKAPDTLPAKVDAAVTAAALAKPVRRPARWSVFAFTGVLSTALAALAIFLTLDRAPKDTFDDPYEAYAQLEKTFSYISDKMERGLEIAGQAEPVFDKTANVFSKRQ